MDCEFYAQEFDKIHQQQRQKEKEEELLFETLENERVKIFLQKKNIV